MGGDGLHPSFSQPTTTIGVNSPIDPEDGALVTVDVAHAEIHEGDSFESDAVNESLADGDTLVLAFKTPAGYDIHLEGHVNIKVAGRVKLWEGPAWTPGTGTVNPVYNRNRNSANVSKVLEDCSTGVFAATGNVIKDPGGYSTVGAVAIRAESFLAPVARGGGVLRSETEWILKRSTTYTVEFTAIGGSNGACIVLDWYEIVAT